MLCEICCKMLKAGKCKGMWRHQLQAAEYWLATGPLRRQMSVQNQQ